MTRRLAPLFTLILAVGLIALIRHFELSQIVLPLKFHDILTVFLSVVIEASPFLLLGSLVAVMVRRTSFIHIVIRHLPKNPFFGLPVSAALGTLLPVCECGNMPIARSLVQKGFPASYATTFLFAAPILNPAVFFSTWIAFRGQPIFIAARFVLGFIVSVAVGAYVLWQEKKGVKIWRTDCVIPEEPATGEDHAHSSEEDHAHEDSFASQVLGEFLAIFPYLLIGALFTALFQAYVPRETFFNADFGIALAILFMMFFAFVISVCSNTDAFLALGFTGIMPSAAILSFLVFGAMIDTKNVLIYNRIFTLRGLLLVSLFIAELVFLLCLGLHKIDVL